MIRFLAWFTRRRPDPVDALIAQKGARPRYSGFDPDLRQRTDEKRRETERSKRSTARRQDSPTETRMGSAQDAVKAGGMSTTTGAVREDAVKRE